MQPEDHTQEIFLGRQPILDRDQHLVAYELLFRSGLDAKARFSNPQRATATVINHAFAHIGFRTALGPYRAFINVDKYFLHDEALQLMPPDQVVIEVLEGSLVTPEVVERCAALKAMGYTLALDDFNRVTDDYLPLLPLASIIKVDLTQVRAADLPGLVTQLRPMVPQLLAEKVETLAEYQRCRELGFDLFQGYYFAHPTILSGRRLRPSQMTALQLISMLAQHAETGEIESVLKHDPALSVSLLRLVNSVAVSRNKHIDSLRQAIMILGRQQLARWLQLLLYADPDTMSPPPLLTMAALRGRFAELVASRISPHDAGMRDAAFMVGILSLTPALLGQALDDILTPMNLSATMRDALLEHKGPLGTILALSELLETGDMTACLELLHHLPHIDAEQLNLCHADAFCWANMIGAD